MWAIFLLNAVKRTLVSRGVGLRPAEEQSKHKRRQRALHNKGLLCFVLWTLFGTFYYAFAKGEYGKGPLGIIEGFFMAVNIGYSIGLAAPIEGYVPCLWFSSFYIILGAVLITVALGYMGEKVAEDASENLFTDLKEREQYEENMSRDKSFYSRLKTFFSYNRGAFMTIVAWIGWMSFMVLYSTLSVGWNFAEGQYFAVSVSSSAGNFSLPYNSPSWLYGLTGIAACVGVPLMALAISSLGMLVQGHKYHQVKKATSSAVSPTELETMKKFGLAHREGAIGKEEFVLLCMMRMGTEAGLIQFICDIFDRIEQERGFVPLENIGLTKKNSFYSGKASHFVSSEHELDEEEVAKMRDSMRSALSAADLLSLQEETAEETDTSDPERDEAMSDRWSNCAHDAESNLDGQSEPPDHEELEEDLQTIEEEQGITLHTIEEEQGLRSCLKAADLKALDEEAALADPVDEEQGLRSCLSAADLMALDEEAALADPVDEEQGLRSCFFAADLKALDEEAALAEQVHSKPLKDKLMDDQWSDRTDEAASHLGVQSEPPDHEELDKHKLKIDEEQGIALNIVDEEEGLNF